MKLLSPSAPMLRPFLLVCALILCSAPAAEAGRAANLARQYGISRAAARQMLNAPYGARSGAASSITNPGSRTPVGVPLPR